MRCEDWGTVLSAGSDGELDDATAAALADHLAGCAACRARQEVIARLNRRVRLRPARPVPDLTGVVLAAAAAQAPRRRTPRARLLRTPAAACLTFGCVIAASVAVASSAAAVRHPVPTATGRALTSSTAGGPDTHIRLTGRRFSEVSLLVRRGTTVEWVNTDPEAHRLDLATGGGSVTSWLRPGERTALRYEQTGTWPFVCTLHPGMRGEVIVVPR